MPDRTTRRIAAELTGDEHDRLQLILNQGLDEWLRAYVVNQLKQISAQPNDPSAVDRALTGMHKAIAAWKRTRAGIAAMPEAKES